MIGLLRGISYERVKERRREENGKVMTTTKKNSCNGNNITGNGI
jgi:hypothetical protein